MLNFDFEGDVENLRPRQLQFISEVLEKRGFKGSKVIVEPVGEAGDNYIADVKRIIVKENRETFKIIAKVSPVNEMLRKMTNTVILFNNESVMYAEVLPKFVQLQRKSGIPEKEIFRYASCYGYFLESPNEIILLEDLQLSNFTMLDRFQSLTNECMQLILKNFAILHSLSYVLKQTEPETFKAVKSKLNDMWAAMAGNEITTLYLSNLETAALEVSDNDDHKKMLKGCVTGIVQSVVKLQETDADSKYSVIVQGDTWTNNIMFKLKNGAPLQCVFIDYQLSKETSPVCDLLFMIFNCSDHKTRLKYFYDWIDYYYFELDKSLQNYIVRS